MSEVEPPTDANQPTQLFNVYVMADTLTKEQWAGGSYDNISAVTIACTVYSMRLQAFSENDLLVAVFDEADTAIAFIGRAQ